jgi:hypothetical protein
MDRLLNGASVAKIDIAEMRWGDNNLTAVANEAQARSQIRD